MIRTVIILLMIGSIYSDVYCDELRKSNPRKFGALIGVGLLVGNETNLPVYKKASIRNYLEFGFKLNEPFPAFDSFESIGIVWAHSFNIREWESRNSYGVKLTWKLNSNIKYSAMVGMVYTAPSEFFESGFHISNYLSMKSATFILIWETLAPLDEYESDGGKRINSIYGGVVLEGRKGFYALIFFYAALIIVGQSLTHGLTS